MLPFSNATISGKAAVFRKARVFGTAHVLGTALMFGNAWVFNHARVYGDAHVCGDARVPGRNAVRRHQGSISDSTLFDRMACVENHRSNRLTSRVGQHSFAICESPTSRRYCAARRTT